MGSVRVIVVGAKGKMGQRIISLIEEDAQMTIAAKIDIDKKLEDVIEMGDIIIDFSSSQSSAENAVDAAKHKKPILIGTTGFNDQQLKIILNASNKTAVLLSPNMSIAVNLLFELVETASMKLGPEFEVSIVEKHHVQKKDKPSGTAKKMAEILNLHSKTASVQSIREDEIVGEHEIEFKSDHETLKIKHEALSRDVFARGAITAAKWLVKQGPGMYEIGDVIRMKHEAGSKR